MPNATNPKVKPKAKTKPKKNAGVHTNSAVQAPSNKLLPWLWFGLALVVVISDQWTKVLANSQLLYNQPEIITSYFNITLRYNYGVAFSIFDDAEGQQRWFLAALALIVSIGIAIWIYRIGKLASFEVVGLALILGGAIGNLYDRVMLGYVVDFIEVHYQNYYWPAFNIADSAICVGAGLLLYDGFFGSKQESEPEEAK